jgi:predicted DNA-binding transcriptional regulator AlpA
MMDKLVSADVVAAEMGVHRGTVYRWVTEGCPNHPIRKGMRQRHAFYLDEVDHWLKTKGGEDGRQP